MMKRCAGIRPGQERKEERKEERKREGAEVEGGSDREKETKQTSFGLLCQMIIPVARDTPELKS